MQAIKLETVEDLQKHIKLDKNSCMYAAFFGQCNNRNCSKYGRFHQTTPYKFNKEKLMEALTAYYEGK